MLSLEVIYTRDSIVPVVPPGRPCTLNFDGVKEARKGSLYFTGTDQQLFASLPIYPVARRLAHLPLSVALLVT
jgi:hypothetical protein